MTPEEMQRTMQFLLNNQAAHDARLAEIEVNLNKLSTQTSALAKNQEGTQEMLQTMQGMMQTMQKEFREGLQKIVVVSEQTLASVRYLAELEAGTAKRVSGLEKRVDALESSGE